MTFSHGTAFVVALGCATSAFAQPAEDCADMANRWSAIYTSAPTIEEMVALFTPDALAWGTNARTLATSLENVRAYFAPAYARPPERRNRNEIQSQDVIQVTDDVWVIAGLYEFTAIAEDRSETKTPARYHFVVVRDGNECKIAAFNSSRLPDAPAAPAAAPVAAPATPPR